MKLFFQLIFVIFFFFNSVFAAGLSLNQEWAGAMLSLRRDFRNNKIILAKKTKKRVGFRPTKTGIVFKKMLKNFPYQTDWMMQDNQNDLMPWLEQADSANIEKKMLKDVVADLEKFRTSNKIINKIEKDFKKLDKSQASSDDPEWLILYVQACEIRRAKRLEKLQKVWKKIIFTKNHTIKPSFFGYTEAQSDAQHQRYFTPGTALCMLEWDGAYAKVEDLINDSHGRIRDPEVSFDGKRLLFAWKKSDRLDDYHLYEMDMKTRRVRQMTFGLNVADYEGCYLPNGDIIFSSSRCVQTVDCWWTEVSMLYRCNKDGKYLRRLCFDQVHSIMPSILEDGRVIYTRWDYNDRGQVFPQGLFQMNPDGTAQTEYYGNNSWFPTVLNHARGIPGTQKVIAVGHGHHTWQAGELMLVDVSKGRQETSGIQLIAPIRRAEEVHIDRYGQEGDLFQYPFPINEKEYLVAYSPVGGRRALFALYYMDINGNRELLVKDPAISCQHPIPLASRTLPKQLPGSVDYKKNTGTFYMQDIYLGPGLKGVKRGTIKKLRVIGLEFQAAGIGNNNNTAKLKRSRTRTNLFSHQMKRLNYNPASNRSVYYEDGGGAVRSTPIAIGNGAWDVKRVLGDATVYEDGSAYFEAPARMAVYFQALDKNNFAVQSMRSWATLMPGENFSCIGCHEDKSLAPPANKKTMAMNAGAEQLKPFYGKPRGFSFQKEIQPILDAKCVQCHSGKKKSRKNKGSGLDLSSAEYIDKKARRKWSRSYLALTDADLSGKKNKKPKKNKPKNKRSKYKAPNIYADSLTGPYVRWISAQSVPNMIPPYSFGSIISPLISMLRIGHSGVKMTSEEMDKIACWIDLCVPFCGDYYEANAWTDKEMKKYNYYQAKRDRLEEMDKNNIQAMLSGSNPPLPKDASNLYRNIGPKAKVTCNSEYKKKSYFAGRNVIDGKYKNTGHGKKYPSWGPHMIDGLWLKLEWDREVYIDRINLYIRADFKPYAKKDHDSWWESGIVELSNGKKIHFNLEKRAEAQTIEIKIKSWPPKPIKWLKFLELIPAEDKWCGFTEVEVMGIYK